MGLVREQQTAAVTGEQMYFLLQLLPIKPSYYLQVTISGYAAHCISCRKERRKEKYRESQVASRTLEKEVTLESGAPGSARNRYRLNLTLVTLRGSS